MKVLFLLFILILSSTVSAEPLNKIVVFGDSLSDNGNLYELLQHIVPESPPYYEGRFTNGPVWVENLAALYKAENYSVDLLDYAYGGAAAINHNDNSVVLSLKYEIGLYLSVHEGKADENSLYVIWIGANNYINPEAFKGEPATYIEKANLAIKLGVQTLIKAGAKHIMLVNLPDLGISPMPDEIEIITEEGKAIPPSLIREKLSSYCQGHNRLLATTVEDLVKTNRQTQILLFDVYSEINKVVYESGQFTNITQSCFATHIDKPTNNTSLQIASHLKLSRAFKGNGEDLCKGYMFFDAVHPTALAHYLVAERAKDFLADKIKFASAKLP